MNTICLHDKATIEAVLRRNTFLNIYQLGDLDDRHWPFTTWHALADGGEVKAVALVYTGLSQPTLLALAEDASAADMAELVRSMPAVLPRRFYAHLAPGLSGMLAEHYAINSRGPHLKMALTDAGRLDGIDTSRVVSLTRADLDGLLPFYAESHPDNSFEPPMLDLGHCYGLRGPDGLVSAAGVHVHSPRYRVAACANIATHPDHRGRGHARTVVARLCMELLRTVEHVGLNVKADNAAALRCYRSLGFEPVAEYEECSLELRW